VKDPKKRHGSLLAAGLLAAGIGTAAPSISAQAADIGGTILFEGGAKIPEGRVAVFLEDSAATGVRGSGTRLESTGAAKAIAFSLPGTDDITASRTLQVVARLEREDGWLLARGSAKVRAGGPVDITLFKAMY